MTHSVYVQQQCKKCDGWIRTSVRSGNTRCKNCGQSQWVPRNATWQGPIDDSAFHGAIGREPVVAVCKKCSNAWETRAANSTVIRCPDCGHAVRTPNRDRVNAGFRPDVSAATARQRRPRRYAVPHGWDASRFTGHLRELKPGQSGVITVDAKYRRGIGQLIQESARIANIPVTVRWTDAEPFNGEERCDVTIKRVVPRLQSDDGIPMAGLRIEEMDDTAGADYTHEPPKKRKRTSKPKPVNLDANPLADLGKIISGIRQRKLAVKRLEMSPGQLSMGNGRCEWPNCPLAFRRVTPDGIRLCVDHARMTGN